ncbi:type III-B CRISPR module-associated protein Cmr5 [bacterium]|nr:type III-B CRISPR module-associated protein Cmr5 [bacterium]
MSKARIEKNIPHAMKILNIEFPKGEIPSAYNGYISSFGASIIQSGLKPTLAFFENKNNEDKKKEDTSVLTKLILNILNPHAKEKETLLQYVLANHSKETSLKAEIIDIAVAIKLCIRTFKLEK